MKHHKVKLTEHQRFILGMFFVASYSVGTNRVKEAFGIRFRGGELRYIKTCCGTYGISNQMRGASRGVRHLYIGLFHAE